MPHAIFIERRRNEVRARFVRRRWAGIVAIDRIAKKQEEVGMLPLHHIKNRIACCPLAAPALATEISTPRKGDRCGEVSIRQGCELTPRRESRFAGMWKASVSCDQHVVAIAGCRGQSGERYGQ